MTIDKLATTVSSLKADLHIHTTFSDGTLTPDTILKYANECKLGALCLTDHDNVGALKYAERHERTMQ